jgi:hypothetical protein
MQKFEINVDGTAVYNNCLFETSLGMQLEMADQAGKG